MTTILDDLRRGVDNLPGGRAVAALRIGKSEEVLCKELSRASLPQAGRTGCAGRFPLVRGGRRQPLP